MQVFLRGGSRYKWPGLTDTSAAGIFKETEEQKHESNRNRAKNRLSCYNKLKPRNPDKSMVFADFVHFQTEITPKHKGKNFFKAYLVCVAGNMA